MLYGSNGYLGVFDVLDAKEPAGMFKLNTITFGTALGYFDIFYELS